MFQMPSHERMQEVLHSPFDIRTHKSTFVDYLELIIRPDGTPEYATPSHMMKLAEIYGKSMDDIYEEYYQEQLGQDGIDYLCAKTGRIAVWNNRVQGIPNEAQSTALRQLQEAGLFCEECAKKILPEVDDPVASHIGNYKAGWVYSLQDFVDAITDPLNPPPVSEFYHQCGRYRLNVFLNRYGELRIWLSQHYPEFADVMKQVMSKYQYQWASDEILRNMGAEIEERAKEYTWRDRYGKQVESRRDDRRTGKIIPR